MENLRLLAISAALLLVQGLTAQEFKGYELEREVPTYLDQIHQELTYPMAWGNSKIKNFNKWRKAARQKVYDCMCYPTPRAKDYAMTVLAEEQRDGYKARHIEFNVSGYSRVRAYVLIPDGDGPHPGVVLLHDHGAHFSIGKEKMIRPFNCSKEVLDDADKWAVNLYGGQYVGDYLAKNGYAVISIDALFWGERGRKEGLKPDKFTMIAGNLMELGHDWSAMISFDDVYTAEFFATLPEVDAERIGCMGCSIGAYRAWMLSALTDRVKACVAVCWMITTDVQLSLNPKYRTENGGFANCLPGLRCYLDYPHIASIACPKPTYFISGSQDKLFHTDGVNKAFGIMRDVWRSQKAEDRLKTEIWDMPHDCGVKVQEAMLGFFDQQLR